MFTLNQDWALLLVWFFLNVIQVYTPKKKLTKLLKNVPLERKKF